MYMLSARSVSELLGADHLRLDVLLAETKQRLSAGDRAAARARFAAFRSGLERHIVAEEDQLFPAFEALLGPPGMRPTAVMRSEHAQIRRLLAEVAAALEPAEGELPVAELAALTALLLAHNGKEERILYPAADRAAQEAGQLESLLGKLRKACPPAQPAETTATPPA